MLFAVFSAIIKERPHSHPQNDRVGRESNGSRVKPLSFKGVNVTDSCAKIIKKHRRIENLGFLLRRHLYVGFLPSHKGEIEIPPFKRRIFAPFLFAYTRKGVPVAARATFLFVHWRVFENFYIPPPTQALVPLPLGKGGRKKLPIRLNREFCVYYATQAPPSLK